MSKLHQRKSWISLAVVPLFSMAVLAGCGSDDDDDGGDITDPDDIEVVDPVDTDANGNNIPDGFETDDATLDTNGNNIVDAFEAADAADDTNENLITDSLEAELTGGADADNDGVDDAALALLNGGGDDVETPVVDVEPIEQTGELNPITLNNGAGTANFTWDGANLFGTVSPTFSTPNPIDSNAAALIAENIVGGNLFVSAQLSNGGTGRGTILLPGISPQFANLASGNNVPPPETDAFSTGAGTIHINTVTGDIAASVRVDLNTADVDGAGNSQSVTAVSINSGAADATGPILVSLALGANGFYEVVQQLSTAALADVLTGNAYFEVLGADGNPFIRGQIPASQ